MIDPPINALPNPVAPEPAAPAVIKHSRLFTHVRSSMFSGLITLVPLFITVYLLWILFDFATKFSRPIAQGLVPWGVRMFQQAPPQELVDQITSWTSPILALLITVVVVYILGVLSIFALGRRILAQFEHFIENLPLVKGIYGTTKQVVGVFRQGAGGGQGFQRVILVEFPRNGTWSDAFVTNTVIDDATGERLVCCFIPMTPNPTSGFFQMFPESAVRATDWTVDMGIKIVLSGGLLAPPHLPAAPPANEAAPAVTG